MKIITVLTATRAEYGLLSPIIHALQDSKEYQVNVVVTGAHLSPEFGLTYKEILDDGVKIHKKIEILMSADTASAISKSMGMAMIGFADYFEEHRPDALLILGDRYETLAVACAAMNARIPIIHLYGGEKTEGAVDEAIRHAITKLSYLHLTSTDEYRKRVIQLGENPERVVTVGSIGVENIREEKLLDKTAFENSIGFFVDENTIIVTYHPVTLENIPSKVQFEKLLTVIEKNTKLRVIFTKANSDTDGRIINQMIDEFVDSHEERCVAFTSLGRIRYLSALKFCAAVVGNSSSGIMEAPSFHIPTVNIGNRQQGRICADTIINCGYEVQEIENALVKAFSKEFREQLSKVKNPYEKAGTSELIVQKINDLLLNSQDVKKHFYDVEFEE